MPVVTNVRLSEERAQLMRQLHFAMCQYSYGIIPQPEVRGTRAFVRENVSQLARLICHDPIVDFQSIASRQVGEMQDKFEVRNDLEGHELASSESNLLEFTDY